MSEAEVRKETQGVVPVRSELDTLAHALAYEWAVCIVEGDCEGPCDGWFYIDNTCPTDADAVLDALKYLELRGLVEHDEENPSIVSIRDESEATA